MCIGKRPFPIFTVVCVIAVAWLAIGGIHHLLRRDPDPVPSSGHSVTHPFTLPPSANWRYAEKCDQESRGTELARHLDDHGSSLLPGSRFFSLEYRPGIDVDGHELFCGGLAAADWYRQNGEVTWNVALVKLEDCLHENSWERGAERPNGGKRVHVLVNQTPFDCRVVRSPVLRMSSEDLRRINSWLAEGE